MAPLTGIIAWNHITAFGRVTKAPTARNDAAQEFRFRMRAIREPGPQKQQRSMPVLANFKVVKHALKYLKVWSQVLIAGRIVTDPTTFPELAIRAEMVLIITKRNPFDRMPPGDDEWEDMVKTALHAYKASDACSATTDSPSSEPQPPPLNGSPDGPMNPV